MEMDSAYKRLWFSVFKTAIEDYRGVHGSILREDARAWLTSDDEDVGSFNWICSVLNVEPFFVRRICHLNGDYHVPLLFAQAGL